MHAQMGYQVLLCVTDLKKLSTSSLKVYSFQLLSLLDIIATVQQMDQIRGLP